MKLRTDIPDEPAADALDPVGEPRFDVALWLAAGGLSQYAALFESQRLDAATIRELTEADLKELGLPMGDRKRLMREIAGLNPAPGRVVDWVDQPQSEVVRRQLTIAFCDLVGSTDLAERLDPEDLIHAVSAYRAACKTVLDRWRGRLAKFLGDGILVLFGWPTANEDDAERAVFAALELVEAVSHLRASDGTPLAARVGIATGLVVIGDVGVDGLYERDCVVGAAPNLAARVQSFAQPGAVAIAPQTRRLIGERFVLESLGEQALKGIAEPVEIWQVTGIHRGKNRFEAKAGRALPPLFGRDGEIARLGHLWQKAAAGEGQAVLIAGEAGIGKSRLLQELRLRTGEAAHMDYQCFHYHQGTALAPFVEKLNHEAGITHGSGTRERIEKIEALAGSHAPDLAEFIPLVAALLSVPLHGREDTLKLSPQRTRERTIDLMIDLTLRDAGHRPLVLVFEDIHWADPSTLGLLTMLTERIAALPVLLVMTSRTPMPEIEAATIALAKLDHAAVSQMLHHLASDTRISPAALESIARSAEGIPLFIEELAGGIEHSLKDGEGGAGVPSTLQDLLAARLDHLEQGKEIVNMAATIGMAFSLELLDLLLPHPPEWLAERMKWLCYEGILRSREGANGEIQFEFRHALVGETAYRMQLKTERRKLHRLIADTLEANFPQTTEHEPGRLGRHFAKAGESILGARYFLKAAQKALQSSATAEAIRNLTEGLAAVDPLPATPETDRVKMRLQAMLGTAHMQASGWAATEVESANLAADHLSYAAGSASEAIWVLWGTWVYLQVRGRIDEGWESAARIRQRAEASGEKIPLLIADMIGLQAHFYGGRFPAATAMARSFLDRYHVAEHRCLTDLYSTDLQLVACLHASMAQWIAGDPAEATRSAETMRGLLIELDHPHSVAWGHVWGSVFDLFRGDTARVAANVGKGAAIAHEQGFAYVTAMARIFEGWVASQGGDPENGARQMATGIQEFCTTGAEIAVPFFLTLRAEALAAAGEYDEALRILNYSTNQIELWGENWQEPEVHRLKGIVFAARGGKKDAFTAAAEFEKALATAEKSGAALWQLRATRDAARHRVGSGDFLGARHILAPLIERLADWQAYPEYHAIAELWENLPDPLD